MKDASSNLSAFSQIRALALDVDGVLTDGGVWWGSEGAEWKRFDFADIMGLSLAQRAGLSLALISGEDSPLVDRFAAKLSIPFVVKGTRDKAAALQAFSAFAEIPLAEICYMGDDVNDLPAMRLSGLAAAPNNASPDVLAFVSFITTKRGGYGAVRELVEALFKARGARTADVYLNS